jgi:hypothetical protein
LDAEGFGPRAHFHPGAIQTRASAEATSGLYSSWASFALTKLPSRTRRLAKRLLSDLGSLEAREARVRRAVIRLDPELRLVKSRAARTRGTYGILNVWVVCDPNNGYGFGLGALQEWVESARK